MRLSRIVGILLLAVVTVTIAYFAFVRRGGASVPSNATLYLRVHGPLKETDSAGLLSPFSSTETLRGVVGTLARAAKDSRIKAVVITPDMGTSMWAQAQELRSALADIKGAGKPVIAYLESGTTLDYYVASVATKVYLMPTGTLEVNGAATYELFFRGALDKLGVAPNLLHIGDFKTYSNTFTEKAMTPAHREMNASLTKETFNELVRAIADGRKRPEDAIRKAIDASPYWGQDAVDAGLVDGLAYEDQLDDAAPVAGTERLEADDYGPDASAGFRAPHVALLYATGEIASGTSTFSAAGGTVLGSETFIDWIRSARADSSVKAIVIRIDSPGGSAIASEAIWRELMLTRDVKPLIVSMGDVAASGGYYIAVPAHAIVAQPGTLTGSIGVVTGKFAVNEALAKLGVTTGVVSQGKMAELNSPFRSFTPAERAKIEAQLQQTYDTFVARVAAGRNATAQQIDAIGQGRVWTGRQARELGLVDALGGLGDALSLAKARAHIDAGTRVVVDVFPKRRSVVDTLLNPFASGGLLAALRPRVPVWPATAAAVVEELSVWERFRPGEPLLLMDAISFR